jgi:5-methylcytosine-specific restriction enzyme B
MATWWVNKGRTYAVELPCRYLFAPLLDKAGRQPDHWEAVADLRPGDAVIHYAKGEVQAVSRVSTAAIRAARPVPLPESWLNIGRMAPVGITNATVPISS